MFYSGTSLEEATVIEFFARMDAEGIEYAILRNYEQYPAFGHDIDLVVRWSVFNSYTITTSFPGWEKGLAHREGIESGGKCKKLRRHDQSSRV